MNKEDFYGIDVDWFAVDKDGNIGIFCTAGNLAIPKSAAIHYTEHHRISKEFDLPHFGLTEIWNDYAAYGLFVYDYKAHHGPYLRHASPVKPMEQSLRDQIMQLEGLPVIDKSFATEESIEIPVLIFNE